MRSREVQKNIIHALNIASDSAASFSSYALRGLKLCKGSARFLARSLFSTFKVFNYTPANLD